MKVLLIEDSPADVELTQLGLNEVANAELVIDVASTLSDALRLLESKQFDVILTDLNLPDSKGLDTISDLAKATKVPIIAHTGDVNEKTVSAVRAGADDFFSKGSGDYGRLLQQLQFAALRNQRSTKVDLDHRIEAIIAERSQAAAESLEFLNIVCEGVQEIFYVAQIEPFELKFMTPSYEVIFERKVAALADNPHDWMTDVVPEDLELLHKYLAFELTPMPEYQNFKIKTASGINRSIRAHTQIITDSKGKPQYFAGNMRDVSAEIAAASAKHEALHQQAKLDIAQATNVFKSQFISMAAHELANPLTPIRLQLASLRVINQHLQDERLGAALEMFDRNVRRLGGLLQDMSQVGKLETNSIEYSLEPMDIAELCRASIEIMDPLAAEKQMTIGYEGPSELLATVDETKITQVVLNLISNAVKYAGSGKDIVVSAKSNEDQIEIEVRDNGNGITSIDLEKLFKPFSRVGDTTAAPGTGLGLYISQGYVTGHCGKISATSPGVGHGTSFHLQLPRDAAKVRAEAAAVEGVVA